MSIIEQVKQDIEEAEKVIEHEIERYKGLPIAGEYWVKNVVEVAKMIQVERQFQEKGKNP